MMWMTLTVACLAADTPAEIDVTPRAVAERFVAHVDEHPRYDEAARKIIHQHLDTLTEPDTSMFVADALAVAEPRFRAALDACEADEHQACIRRMGALALTDDPFVSSYGALFAARSLVEDLELEYAELLLSYQFREDFALEAHCAAWPEMMFLLGYCRYHLFDIPGSVEILERFLDEAPDAPEVLRKAAADLVESTNPPPRKSIGQVAVLMTGAGDMLGDGDAGREVQLSQAKAMAILEDMINKACNKEKKQCSGGGQKGQCNSSKPGDAKGVQESAEAAKSSTISGGDSGQGELHNTPRASPAEMWGKMRPQERAKILQSLQQDFPSRYRDLVEQYYEELGKQR